MDADRDRTLRIEIPPCFVSSSNARDWDDLTNLNGWLPVTTTFAPNVLYWSGSIDLSGYARDYKTFYPAGGVIQEGPYWIAAGGSGQTILTIVSSIPLKAENIFTQFSGNSGAGFIDANFSSSGTGQQDWNTVLFAESQVNLINSNFPALGICQPITVKQSGSLSPTAAQVLYVMKMVIPTKLAGEIGSSLSIPASRVILPGTMDQEPELEYMMRLSRSVELANQV